MSGSCRGGDAIDRSAISLRPPHGSLAALLEAQEFFADPRSRRGRDLLLGRRLAPIHGQQNL